MQEIAWIKGSCEIQSASAQYSRVSKSFNVGHASIRWALTQIDREEEGAEIKLPTVVEEFFAGLVVLAKVLEELNV